MTFARDKMNKAEYNRQWQKTKKGKLSHQKACKKYWRTKKGKLTGRKSNKNYKLRNPECQRQWRKEHPDYCKNYSRKWREKYPDYGNNWARENSEKYREYRQTEKGKLVHTKSQAKRKRNLDWIQLFENPFDELEIIEWHHINNTFVVAIPQDLHRLYYGTNHKEKLEYIIKQIYGG